LKSGNRLLRKESIAGQTWSYQYDAIGNRTSMKRSAAWVTSPDGTPSGNTVSQADGAAFERVTATVPNALNQMVTVNRPQSVELSGIASSMASLELQVTPQPSDQNPDPVAVIAAKPANQNRPPASGEPDGWLHWLSDTRKRMPHP
jgi:YD repeat-containing protein